MQESPCNRKNVEQIKILFYMRRFIFIAVAILNIYNNELSIVNNIHDLCGGEQGAVMGVSPRIL